MATPESPLSAQSAEAASNRRLFHVLFGFARHYERQFCIVALFSFLYSAGGNVPCDSVAAGVMQ